MRRGDEQAAEQQPTEPGCEHQDVSPDFTRRLSVALAAAIGVNDLDRIRHLYPGSIDEKEIASLRKVLVDWLDHTIAGPGFANVKKVMEGQDMKTAQSVLDERLPGVLCLFHPSLQLDDAAPKIEERTTSVVEEGMRLSPRVIGDVFTRIVEIKVLDCRMPSPVDDKTYQEPTRFLMLLQRYWGLCKQLIIETIDAPIGFRPHPLLDLIVNAQSRISMCFEKLSSCHGAREVQDTIARLIQALLSADPEAFIPEEYTMAEVAKVDVFLAEAKLSLGSTRHELTHAEGTFIKVFEDATLEHREMVRKAWDRTKSRILRDARDREGGSRDTQRGSSGDERRCPPMSLAEKRLAEQNKDVSTGILAGAQAAQEKGKSEPAQNRQLSRRATKVWADFQDAIVKGKFNDSPPKDREVYDWLLIQRRKGEDLPKFPTWQRYLREARKFHGHQKNTPRRGRATGPSIDTETGAKPAD